MLKSDFPRRHTPPDEVSRLGDYSSCVYDFTKGHSLKSHLVDIGRYKNTKEFLIGEIRRFEGITLLCIIFFLLFSCATPLKPHHWVKIDGNEISTSQEALKLKHDYERCAEIMDRATVGMNPDYITEARLKVLIYCMGQKGWMWKEGERPRREGISY